MDARGVVRLFGRALVAWWNDNVPRLGASLAYYTLFAIAPVLLVAIGIAGLVFGEEAARGQIVGQLDELVGPEGAKAIENLLKGAWRPQAGRFATVVGGITFLVAATGAFLELQAALNAIWRVEAKPEVSPLTFVTDRLRSFGLVLAIGFLLLVSLAVSAALAALARWVGSAAPELPLLSIVNLVLSITVTAALFALLFYFLPDVRLRWRDVAVGALVTAILFTVGKEVIGLYLGQSATASAYGAAGSVVVLLLWVYYSAQVVLLGAEFTRLYAAREGGPPPPEEFAEKRPTAICEATTTPPEEDVTDRG